MFKRGRTGSYALPTFTSRASGLAAAVLAATLFVALLTGALAAAPVATPTVSSTTHPDQNAWYSSRDATVQVAWSTTSTSFDLVGVSSETSIGTVLGVTAAGSDRAYGAGANGLTALNVADPTSPKLVYKYPTGDVCDNVVVDGGTAYITARTSGLYILDVSNPATATLRFRVPAASALDVAVGDRKAYLAADNALRVYNVTDPSNPTTLGSVSVTATPEDVALVGHYVYAACGAQGLAIIDVADPANPLLVGSYALPSGDEALSVSASGDNVYLCDRKPAVYGRILVISAADRTQPTLVRSLNTAEYPSDMVVSDPWLVAADANEAMRLYDVSSTADPKLVAMTTPSPSMGYGIALSGSRLYAASMELRVWDLGIPTGYSYVVDQSPATVPDAVSDSPVPDIGLAGLPDGDDFFHVSALIGSGTFARWTSAAHFRLKINSTGPSAPTVSSPTHPDPNTWYALGSPALKWSTVDTAGGVAAYSYLIDHEPATDPPSYGPSVSTSVTYTGLGSGAWWFHVRAVDTLGLWGPSTHFRVRIDQAGPLAPEVSSSTHPDPDAWYAARSLAVSWSAVDAGSGVAGYSYVLDHSSATVPSASSLGASTSHAYTGLAPGQWWFHVRAVDALGHWGSATHRLFSIAGPATLTRPTVRSSRGRAVTTVARGSSFRAVGLMRPKHRGAVKLYLYRKVGRAWRAYRTPATARLRYVGSSTEYSATFRLSQGGAWMVKAYHRDDEHTASWSPARTFTVR